MTRIGTSDPLEPIRTAPTRIVEPLPTGERVNREDTTVNASTAVRARGHVTSDAALTGQIVYLPRGTACPAAGKVLAAVNIPSPPRGKVASLTALVYGSFADIITPDAGEKG